MNREIKFRAYFYDGKDYSTGELVSLETALSEDYIEGSGNDLMPTDDCTILMQFTGFKDSEDLDIYEGDILDGTFRAIVEFRSGSYIVTSKENRHVRGLLSEFIRIRLQASNRCKIIGNIFGS